MIVTGVAAVLDQPMRGRPFTFTRPRPHLTETRAPVTRDGKRVGEVLGIWVDGHLVRWEGLLNRPVLPVLSGEEDHDPLVIPLPEPSLYELVAAGRLVGLTDLVRGRMTTRASGTVLSDWSVAGVTLLPHDARPWDELTLKSAS